MITITNNSVQQINSALFSLHSDLKQGAASKALNYSEEETDTGTKFIDGYKIFKKTIVFDEEIASSETKTSKKVGIIDEPESIVNIEGMLQTNTGAWLVIGTANPDSAYSTELWIESNGDVYYGYQSRATKKLIITVYYTKTTN